MLSPELDVQYYLRRNPGYVRGTGLAMIAPLSLGNLIMSATQYLSHLVLRGFRRPLALGTKIRRNARPLRVRDTLNMRGLLLPRGTDR